MHNDIQEHLNAIQRTGLIVFGALFMSLAMYVGIAFLIASSPGAATDISQLQMPLTLAAIVAGGTSVLLPRWMLSDRNLERMLTQPADVERLARRNGAVDQARLRMLQELDAPSLKLLSVAQRWMPSVIVGVALAETIAACGLVLAILSKQPFAVVPFAAASAVLMLSHFPRLAPVIERAKQLQRL